MINRPTVSNPVVPALIIESLTTEQSGPSRLGDILAAPRRPRTFPEWLTDACELFVPKPAWCGHLAVHKLSEFPEMSARIVSEVPLFARGK